MMSLTGNSHPNVTRCFRGCPAPPHHTLRGDLPAFPNLHGSIYNLLNIIKNRLSRVSLRLVEL